MATSRCGLQLLYSRGRCHLLLGLDGTGLPPLQSIRISSVRSLAGRAESTTSPILRGKCHDRDSNPHSTDQPPKLESGALNLSAMTRQMKQVIVYKATKETVNTPLQLNECVWHSGTGVSSSEGKCTGTKMFGINLYICGQYFQQKM